jgi:hypothetical protein
MNLLNPFTPRVGQLFIDEWEGHWVERIKVPGQRKRKERHGVRRARLLNEITEVTEHEVHYKLVQVISERSPPPNHPIRFDPKKPNSGGGSIARWVFKEGGSLEPPTRGDLKGVIV